MPEETKQLKYDIVGSEVITTALGELLNEFPLLDGEEILFSTLDKDSGLGWFPTTGAVITEEKTNIKGITKQTCNYPFYVIRRTGASKAKQKVAIKEFLDNMGRWLEKHSVTAGGEEKRLGRYPELTGNREITEIARQTHSYLDTTNDGVEDWAILIALKYKNEFRRK